MAEGRRSGGGAGRSQGGSGGRASSGRGSGGRSAGGASKSTGKGAGKGQSSRGRSGGPSGSGAKSSGQGKGQSARSRSAGSAGGSSRGSGGSSRSGGTSKAGGAGSSGRSSAGGSSRSGSGRPSAGSGGRAGGSGGQGGRSGRPSSGGSRTGGAGRSSSARGPARANARGGARTNARSDERETRQGGFGPYTVDTRDEETRERRNEPRGRGRDSRDDRRGRERDRDDRDRDVEETRKPARPALRVVGTRKPAGAKSSGTKQPARATKRSGTKQPARPAKDASARARRRRRGPAGIQDELAQLAGRDSARALGTLMAAADAYSNDREREAIRILRPLRDRLPGSPSVRELMGLSQYRVGNYNAAAKELEAYYELSGEVDQHPVLMDCYRAQHRWKKVADLWEELAAVSPSADVVTEGRIVYAGALADQDKLPEALALLRKRGEPVKQPKDHHLRVWYALADLEERAGNLARARELFHQVARVEPGFSDVAERLASLG